MSRISTASAPMPSVATLSFGHTLSPSAKTTNQLVISLVSSLTPESRQMVLDGLLDLGAL